MSEVAMKACPFCGGQPFLHENGWSLSISPEWSVQCKCLTVTKERATKEKAIAAWNRRSPAQVEGLRELASDLKRRAASCAVLIKTTQTNEDTQRLDGKRQAYEHAAELLKDALSSGVVEGEHGVQMAGGGGG